MSVTSSQIIAGTKDSGTIQTNQKMSDQSNHSSENDKLNENTDNLKNVEVTPKILDERAKIAEKLARKEKRTRKRINRNKREGERKEAEVYNIGKKEEALKMNRKLIVKVNKLQKLVSHKDKRLAEVQYENKQLYQLLERNNITVPTLDTIAYSDCSTDSDLAVVG